MTFDPNGGSVSPTTKSAANGTTYTNLPTPTWTDHTFDGWFANFSGGQYVDMGRTYMYEDKISIHFRAFMVNWTSYQQVISCTEGGGWNLENDGNGYLRFAIYDKGVGYKHALSSLSLASMSSGWHIFDMTFDGTNAKLYIDNTLVGTSANFSSGKIGYNNTNTILLGAEAGPSTTPAGSTYFNGRIANVIISNSNQKYSGTDRNSFSAPNQNITLYARWQPITITVNFYRNQSSSDTSMVTQTFSTGVSGNRFGYNNDGTPIWGTSGDFGSWTNSGYAMLGWSSSRTATSATWTTYSEVIDPWIENYSPTINLYAVWMRSSMSGTVTVTSGGGTDQDSGIYYSMTMYLQYNLARNSSTGEITGTATLYARMSGYTGSWPGYVYGTFTIGNKTWTSSGLADCNGTLATFSGSYGTGTSLLYKWVHSGNLAYNCFGNDSGNKYINFASGTNSVGGGALQTLSNVSQGITNAGDEIKKKIDEVVNDQTEE